MRETRRLLIEANLLDIEVPTVQVWNKSQFGDFLPTSEREKLRRRIDEEKTRRRDVKAWWWKTIIGPAITTIIGLIGALTGLVAVVLSHSK